MTAEDAKAADRFAQFTNLDAICRNHIRGAFLAGVKWAREQPERPLKVLEGLEAENSRLKQTNTNLLIRTKDLLNEVEALKHTLNDYNKACNDVQAMDILRERKVELDLVSGKWVAHALASGAPAIDSVWEDDPAVAVIEWDKKNRLAPEASQGRIQGREGVPCRV